MKIEVTSPTRVDLAGGTLDCWPLYLFVGDCVTINLSIDVMTRVTLTERADSRILYESPDLNYKREFADLTELLNCEDSSVSLVREHLRYSQPKQGFELRTSSESPVGGGLGGSSSLSISLMKAFDQWLGSSLPLLEMVRVASNIEAKVLKTPTGTQDYFPAIAPGLNFIHYSVAGPKCEKFMGDTSFFKDRMLMVNTGKSHHSGINNWNVIRSAVEGNEETLSQLKQLALISERFYAAIKSVDLDSIVELFHQEYEYRIRLSDSFSSPLIEKVKAVAMEVGAQAIKICGAGGGGCVLVWVEPGQRDRVKVACESAGFEVLRAQAFEAGPV